MSKNYKIRREFTKRDLWVELDTDKVIQVLDNILNNAIKYSPDGGVITCRLVETHNNVVFSISDQGLGIPKKISGKSSSVFIVWIKHVREHKVGLV